VKLSLLFLLPALLAGQQAPVVQDRDKASLEGQVLNAATGEPLRKARLTLRMNVAQTQTVRQQQTAGTTATITVVSDAAGKFLFPNLDPGDYQLAARRDGFMNTQLGNTGGNKKAEPIVLTRGDSKTGFTVKMTPFGALTGRLTDEDGDPIQAQHVALLTYQYTTRGRELIESPHTAATDDLGEYRIYNVPPGKYFLKAGASQRGSRVLRSEDDGLAFAPAASREPGKKPARLRSNLTPATSCAASISSCVRRDSRRSAAE
jgi:hypothetical protein